MSKVSLSLISLLHVSAPRTVQKNNFQAIFGEMFGLPVLGFG